MLRGRTKLIQLITLLQKALNLFSRHYNIWINFWEKFSTVNITLASRVWPFSNHTTCAMQSSQHLVRICFLSVPYWVQSNPGISTRGGALEQADLSLSSIVTNRSWYAWNKASARAIKSKMVLAQDVWLVCGGRGFSARHSRRVSLNHVRVYK